MSETPMTDIQIGQISSRWAMSSKIPCRDEKSTGSTNDLAKDEAFEAAAEDGFKVYLTDQQTAGRGRGTNTWVNDEAGSALLSSWSFLLQDPPQPTLTPKLGLALAKAAAGTWPFLNWSLKAPNDLELEGRKIAGLLVETITQGADARLIVGLGLNVWGSPESVATATHLTDELPEGAPLLGDDWIAFLERWLFELTEAVGRAGEPLNTTETTALREFMNRRAGSKIDEVLPDGSLVSGGKKKPWMEI